LTRDRQKRFDAAMAEVALMPAEQQVDALLELLTTVLNETSTEVVRQKRNQLMEHFANCGCSYETCSALLEMVDHHLAMRERWAARQEAEARRAAKASLRMRAEGKAMLPLAADTHRSPPGLRR
jgi:hypothetical protein